MPKGEQPLTQTYTRRLRRLQERLWVGVSLGRESRILGSFLLVALYIAHLSVFRRLRNSLETKMSTVCQVNVTFASSSRPVAET
jgi:hypothetical protein